MKSKRWFALLAFITATIAVTSIGPFAAMPVQAAMRAQVGETLQGALTAESARNHSATPLPISSPASIGTPHSCVQDYPPISQQLGEQGITLLAFIITENGNVANVTVANSSGSDRLDNAALSCVANWHYRPAMENGVPVAVSWKAQVRWALNHDVQPTPNDINDVATAQGETRNKPPSAIFREKPVVAIKSNKATVGMSKDAVLKALGKPDTKELIPPDDELWVYGSERISISKGKVTYVGR